MGATIIATLADWLFIAAAVMFALLVIVAWLVKQ